jgi:hypothetical protein
VGWLRLLGACLGGAIGGWKCCRQTVLPKSRTAPGNWGSRGTPALAKTFGHIVLNVGGERWKSPKDQSILHRENWM